MPNRHNPAATAARLQRLRALAEGIRAHPVDASEDELMRMVRIADAVDEQWREAVLRSRKADETCVAVGDVLKALLDFEIAVER